MEGKEGFRSKLSAHFNANIFLSSQCCVWLLLRLPYMDIYVPPAVIHHIDQMPECMTCVRVLITLPSYVAIPVARERGGAGKPGTLALLSRPLLSACCRARWRGSHRFLCRIMWAPIPSPVAASMSGGSLSGLTGLMMFLQPLTWQTITNRNEPPATDARSAAVQWSPVYHTTLIGVRRTTIPNIKQQINAASVPSLSTSPLSTGIPLIAWVFFFPWPVWTKWSNPGELI